MKREDERKGRGVTTLIKRPKARRRTECEKVDQQLATGLRRYRIGADAAGGAATRTQRLAPAVPRAAHCSARTGQVAGDLDL